METSEAAASAPTSQPQAAPAATRTKRPLPKYTTIDLENELPELYSTSLNPNLRDPDLTLFYNQSGPPFYNYKRNSPPPSYPNSVASGRSPPLSPTSKYVKQSNRFKYCLVVFFVIFVAIPLFLFILSILMPEVTNRHHRTVA